MRRPRPSRPRTGRGDNVIDLLARNSGAQPRGRPRPQLPSGPLVPWLLLLLVAVLWALWRWLRAGGPV